MDVRDVSITQALHEGGIGPIPIGVIGSPETSHADHGFMTGVEGVGAQQDASADFDTSPGCAMDPPR